MITCINCGKKAEEDFMYCTECKKTLSENINKAIEAYEIDLARIMTARKRQHEEEVYVY